MQVGLCVSSANRSMCIEYEKAYVCVYVFACMCIGSRLSTTSLNIYCVLAFGGTPYFFYNIQMINWKDNNCTIDTMKRRLTKSQCHWFTYSSRCDITYTYGINTQSGPCAIMYEPLCVCMWILGVCVWTCDVLFAPHDSYISSSGQNVTGFRVWIGVSQISLSLNV